ncbi:hypothetical protein E2320_007339 [Naja naja]|nr:hypothetical protein E2320_007339 [Naja naja]
MLTFTQIESEFMGALALGLPDPTTLFTLFVHKWKGIAMSVLTQKLGSWQRPVALGWLVNSGNNSPATIQLEVYNTLNPATLLPQVDTELYHDCVQVVDSVHASTSDLSDQPIPNADCEWFTDGSSFMIEGLRKAGYAVVKP